MKGGVRVERARSKIRRGGVPGGAEVGELEVVEMVAGEPPGRHRMTGSGPVLVPQWMLLPSPKSLVPPSPCTRILLEFFSGFSLQRSLSLWLQRPIALPRTAPWSPQ